LKVRKKEGKGDGRMKPCFLLVKKEKGKTRAPMVILRGKGGERKKERGGREGADLSSIPFRHKRRTGGILEKQATCEKRGKGASRILIKPYPKRGEGKG